MTTYVELHCHSNFSFLDGASHVQELVQRAARLGHRALALTDHNGLYGAMEFARYANEQGLQPITGAEVTLASGHHLTLLVESQQGYANLCRLLSHAHLTHARGEPAVDEELLNRHAAGLIALSGCPLGETPSLAAAGRLEEAWAAAGRYAEIFGARNFYIELQQNLVYGDTPRNRRLLALARRLGLGVVATNNVHYHARRRHRLQDVLVAIKHRTTLDDAHRIRRANSEFYLKSAAEMEALFAERLEAVRNTCAIAERCAFDLTRDIGYRFPDYPCPDGLTADDVLRDACLARLYTIYADSAELRDAALTRLEDELRLVARHKLAGFFLIYRDLLELGKEVAREIHGPQHGDRPPGRGRGSSVSSIICYLIGLSPIDPVKNNLFVGRFLNEDIPAVPDIDLDFAREVREQLILRVYERYGHEHVGLVCTFPTYRLPSAVRDIGKALGLPLPELSRLIKLAERGSSRGLRQEMERFPEFARRLEQPLWRHLVELAEQISGFPRHVSQHVGGMVISSQPLVEIVPLENARMAGRVVCQWDKDSVDDARMVKVDFLALGMLSLVDECLALIALHKGDDVDLSRIPYDDAAVYDMICAGDTIGVFQIESRAQIQTVVRTQPRTLDDLTVQVAIVRPGPITGGALNPYIKQRQLMRSATQAQPLHLHPRLERVLGETHGAILFQEQVVQVMMELAGFTAGQAESFRRAMSRKHSEEAMRGYAEQFFAGARANDVDDETAARIFQQLCGFAQYGFPKSHAAAFGLLAYQSSWLKHHYPAEFYCALFNNQPMGFYPPHAFANDAQRHGTPVLPPDINASGGRCTVEGTAVRIGFNYVDGLGADVAQALQDEREQGGPYASLLDLARRTRLRREALEHLIAVGACDSFGLRRRELLWQLGLCLPDRSMGSRARPTGWQLALELPTEQDMVALKALTDWERMVADYELLGLSARYHPIGLLRPILPEGLTRAAELEHGRDGSRVRLAGLVVCRQRPGTAKGILFMLLEDETGLANIVVHPPLYERRRAVVRGTPFLIIAGRLQLRDGTVNVIASEIEAIERPAASGPRPTEPLPAELLLAQGRRLRALPGDLDEQALTHLRLVAPASHDFR